MPKKTKDKNKPKKKGEVEPGPETDPFVLFRNYSKQCESVGVTSNESIKRALCFNENENSSSQLLIGEDKHNSSSKQLGSWGCRALVMAILGKCNHENSTKYTAFKEIRIWRSNIGDHGAMAIGRLLREAGPEFNISLIELSDNNIGVEGALALGRSLCAGMMKSLVNLNLDYNSSIGSNGVAGIAKGLCSNKTLKKLSLRYCGIDENGSKPICQLLSSPKIAIDSLDLSGNRLGGKGLCEMCPGIIANSKLQTLNLSDNDIRPKDVQEIKHFSDAIKDHKSLAEINLLYNNVGVEGGLALLEGIEENKLITSFTADTSLPPDIYSALNRVATKTKGKKKKAKKKKK